MRGVIVRTRKRDAPRRTAPTCASTRNAIVLIIDDESNPRGTRIFGAVARELRDARAS